MGSIRKLSSVYLMGKQRPENPEVINPTTSYNKVSLIDSIRSHIGSAGQYQTIEGAGAAVRTETYVDTENTEWEIEIPKGAHSIGHDYVFCAANSNNRFNPDPSFVTLGYWIRNSDGQIEASSANFYTDYVNVNPGVSYVFYGTKKADPTVLSRYNRIAWYDVNKNWISNSTYTVNTKTAAIAPSNAVYARLHCNPLNSGALTQEGVDSFDWVFCEGFNNSTDYYTTYDNKMYGILFDNGAICGIYGDPSTLIKTQTLDCTQNHRYYIKFTCKNGISTLYVLDKNTWNTETVTGTYSNFVASTKTIGILGTILEDDGVNFRYGYLSCDNTPICYAKLIKNGQLALDSVAMKFTVNDQSQYAMHGCYDFVKNKPFGVDGTYMFEGLTGNKYYGGTYENAKNLQTVNTNNNKWYNGISAYGFANCTSLTSVTNLNMDGVTDASYMFNNCINLTTGPSTLPNTLTNMDHTFYQCYNLVNVPTIPNSVTNLDNTFYRCSNITSIPSIGNSATSMNSTFYNCTNLVTGPSSIPNTVTSMNSTFYNCTNLTTSPVLSNSVTDLTSTFARCSSLVNAPVIPNSVTTMVNTFDGCTSLTNVPSLQNTAVTSLQNTFTDCSSLVNAPELPANVTSLPSTFNGCTALVNAPVIPNTVTSMSWTFFGCSSLENAPAIPNSVTSMTAAFSHCGLRNAPVIPDSVVNLSNTFSYCPVLIDAPTIPSSVTNLSDTFSNTPIRDVPDIPNSVTNLSGTFSGCTYIGVMGPAININIAGTGVTNMDSTFYSAIGYTTNPINIYIRSQNITTADNCFYLCAWSSGGYAAKNVYIPYNTATHNAFLAAGYDENGTLHGVYLHPLV